MVHRGDFQLVPSFLTFNYIMYKNLRIDSTLLPLQSYAGDWMKLRAQYQVSGDTLRHRIGEYNGGLHSYRQELELGSMPLAVQIWTKYSSF